MACILGHLQHRRFIHSPPKKFDSGDDDYEVAARDLALEIHVVAAVYSDSGDDDYEGFRLVVLAPSHTPPCNFPKNFARSNHSPSPAVKVCQGLVHLEGREKEVERKNEVTPLAKKQGCGCDYCFTPCNGTSYKQWSSRVASSFTRTTECMQSCCYILQRWRETFQSWICNTT